MRSLQCVLVQVTFDIATISLGTVLMEFEGGGAFGKHHLSAPVSVDRPVVDHKSKLSIIGHIFWNKKKGCVVIIELLCVRI